MPHQESDKLPLSTYLFFFAQSINLTAAVLSVSMAALVGMELARSQSLSTLPYGFQFLLVMLATYPASRLMVKFGRKRAFFIGNAFLALSGVVGFIAVEQESFILLTASHAFLGIYIAFANFNRFAATDDLYDRIKAKAISLVVAGGVLAAIVGPLISRFLRDVEGFGQFALCYAAFVVLAVLASVITYFAPCSKAAPAAGNVSRPGQLVLSRPIVIAIGSSAIGYCLMNLLMMQASMHMKGMHVPFSEVNNAIQWHVLAMFFPSFFTGRFIRAIGSREIIAAGFVLLLFSCAINICAQDHMSTFASLLILGLGWNLTYIAGGCLLAESLAERGSAIAVQGMNDTAIAVLATLGAFMPSVLLSFLGWAGTNVAAAALCVTCIGFVCLFSDPHESTITSKS